MNKNQKKIINIDQKEIVSDVIGSQDNLNQIIMDSKVNLQQIKQDQEVQQKDHSHSDQSDQVVKDFKKIARNIAARSYVKQWANKLQTRMYKNLKSINLYLLNEINCKSDQKKLMEDQQKDTNIFKKNLMPSTFLNIVIKLLKFIFCYSQLIKIMDFIPIFQHTSSFKFFWELLILLDTIIMVIQMTIYVAFFGIQIHLISDYTEYILVLAQVLDILSNFNTSYFQKGKLITNHAKIIDNYLNGNFLKDFISVTPMVVHYILNSEQQTQTKQGLEFYQFYKLLCVIRLYKFIQFTRRIQERYDISHTIKNVFQLGKLLGTTLLISHFFACIWIFFARATSYKQSTWLDKYELADKDWKDQYINSYYFSTVTMITVGYGDILPTNNDEKILSVFTMLIACGVFGYSLNIIGTIINEFFQRQLEIDQKLEVINKYMKKKKIKLSLQYEIREYLEYYWVNLINQNDEAEEQIINQLSNQLKKSLLYDANKIILQDTPIFKYFSQQVRDDTLNIIKEIRTPPEQIIIQENTLDDSAIYFIESGRVEMVINEHGGQKAINVKHLGVGNNFGSLQFFTNKQRHFTIKTLEFCTFLVINRQEFIEILQKYQQEYQKFCQIKDNILIYQIYDELNVMCESCSLQDHTIIECPFVHLQRKQYFVATKHINQTKKSVQERQVEPKRQNKKHQFIDIHQIQGDALDFQDDFMLQMNNIHKIEEYQEMIENDIDYFYLNKSIQAQIKEPILNYQFINSEFQADDKNKKDQSLNNDDSESSNESLKETKLDQKNKDYQDSQLDKIKNIFTKKQDKLDKNDIKSISSNNSEQEEDNFDLSPLKNKQNMNIQARRISVRQKNTLKFKPNLKLNNAYQLLKQKLAHKIQDNHQQQKQVLVSQTKTQFEDQIRNQMNELLKNMENKLNQNNNNQVINQENPQLDNYDEQDKYNRIYIDLNFEFHKIFKFYFTKGNIDRILQKVSKIRKEKLKSHYPILEKENKKSKIMNNLKINESIKEKSNESSQDQENLSEAPISDRGLPSDFITPYCNLNSKKQITKKSIQLNFS